MGTIVLLVVAAAWAAVLVPPLMRGRQDNRPSSSVIDFRRQLSTLQRSAPIRPGSPMRSMARPLAPSPVRQRSTHMSHATPTRGIVRHNVSRQHLIKQRRQNVLVALALVTLGSAFIAFTTKSDLFIYVFVLTAISLAGYCYKLSQLRRYPSSQQPYRRDWVRAA
jgi:hypothetical protein